ncbi:ribonuclease H-like domain-containing protein [Aspergillus undulatus]|uniref:ribonuclease H-like domain-containing protein n=1 Tax=Aspergillus undulatus TaxID=1810928 RepID=UPI003CCD2996
MGHPPPLFRCVECGKDTFKTAEALAAHQAAVGHQKFSGPARVPRSENSRTLATTPRSRGIIHKFQSRRHKDARLDLEIYGRVFFVLSEEEQSLVYEMLLSKCHSAARLQVEGYRMTVTPQERNPSRKNLPNENSDKDANGDTKLPNEKQSLSQKTPDETAKETTAQDKLYKSSDKKPREIVLFMHTPRFVLGLPHNKRKALALDCEMVEVEGNRTELAFLSVIDFLTGEILIHKYVKPTKRVLNWVTRHSGITRVAMNAAIAAGQALDGWPAAQQALWRYADAGTILIGHSLHNDLKALRIIHPKIVDSAILSAEPVFNPEPEVRLRRLWALKKVAEMFLNRDIQTGGQRGHDCLEDTYATRDVVIWCLLNPDQLIAWARNAKVEHDLRMEEERKARERERQERNEQKERKEVALLMAIELE